MMKATSKRRRTKQQIKDEKAEEERKQTEISAKLAAFHEVQQQNEEMQKQLAEA